MRSASFVVAALLSIGCGEDSKNDSSPNGGGSGGTIATGGQSGSGGTPSTGGSSGIGGTGATGGVGATGGTGATGGAPAQWIWGVTVDGITPLAGITETLGKHAKKPTTRIVFDEFVPATDYLAAATAIHGVSFVMGEILDSFYVAEYSTDDYLKRANEYVSLLAPVVDIWEIGNEINGEWLCGQGASSCTPTQTAAVVAKIDGAYEVVKSAGGKTALTLYYNEDCWSSPDNEMFTWTTKNVSSKLKQGLDYVFVSYYEDDCNDLQPDWQAVFSKLAALFPSAKLGIGECGTLKAADKKAEYVTRYYTLKVNEPRFVGGSFWWYYRQDMVPYTDKPLWNVLDAIMAAP